MWSTKSDDVTSGVCRVHCMTGLHIAQSTECVEILLEHESHIAAQDCMGKTPVSMVTFDGRLEVFSAY